MTIRTQFQTGREVKLARHFELLPLDELGPDLRQDDGDSWTWVGDKPPEPVALACNVRVWLPTMQPIDPRTGTNWEGVGVEPDLPGGEDALATAVAAARAALAEE
jgi:hypothetical protein